MDEQEFTERADTELRMLIEKSAVVLHVVGEGPPTVKSAVEMGFAILMNKPIILVVPPNRAVPEHLSEIAAAIIPMDSDMKVLANRVHEALATVYPEGFGGKRA